MYGVMLTVMIKIGVMLTDMIMMGVIVGSSFFMLFVATNCSTFSK